MSELEEAIDRFIDHLDSYQWYRRRRDKDPYYGGNNVDEAREAAKQSLAELLGAFIKQRISEIDNLEARNKLTRIIIDGLPATDGQENFWEGNQWLTRIL